MSSETSNSVAVSNHKNASSASDVARKHQLVVGGWGSRENFQYSYGLKMTPDDMEEDDAIIEAMVHNDGVEEDHSPTMNNDR
ncbi:hypothetical protein PG985_005626 [Apiospora marii]|uniref:uncharacterized protein n=1 Tax=Apiospora marii TaxID=335849 RepID=UPI003130455D